MLEYKEIEDFYDDTIKEYVEVDDEGVVTHVDLPKLIAKNSDVKGWMYIEGTAINYPLLQGPDNDYYLYVNYDDKYSSEMIKNCKGKVVYYGLEFNENQIKNISRGLEGISFDLGGYEGIESKLLGVINVFNLSSAFLTLKELGFKEDSIKETIKDINTINGRLEKVYSNEFSVIFDYAHTPDAMEKVLVEIKPLASNRLIVLFGCGGNRDKTKRPIMGEIATRYGDVVYVTSDNPRNEEPLLIIKDILKGCKNDKKIVIEENREIALRKALSEIQEGDILMVLGKGHEEYQIVKDKYLELSDKKMICKWLQS
jgi:UDP-N-acetylmuramoyl-L-alanyl-D-glutamate--2,6-diaminopimelate ligase